MTARDFCYWLQGYIELQGAHAKIDEAQLACIRNHLALVFKHDIDTPDPTGELQATHDGKPKTPAKPSGFPYPQKMRC